MKRLAVLAALIVSGHHLAAQDPASSESALPLSTVTWERLVNAADEPHNWLMYSGTLDSQRYSRLEQIDGSNVAAVELKWAYSIR